MAIYKVQGPDGRILTVEGPANAPEAEVIQQAHLLYTQQQAHEAKTGIGAAFKHGLMELKASDEQGIATLLGAAGMKNYSQDWLNASEAARKEAAGMYEGTTEEDIARARAENGPIAELLAKGKKHIAEPLGEMGGRFGPTMVMSAPMFGPLGLAAAGVNEYLASVGEVKHRGGDDTKSMLYGGPLAALNVAKIPTGRLGTYASEAVAKVLGRVTPEAAEAGVREAALAAREAKAAEVAGVANKGGLGPLSPVENLAVQEAKAAPFQAAQEAATRAATEVPGQRTWGGFAGDVAAGAAGNAAVNIPLSLASEALTRHATGEKPMTAEEAGDLSQQLALLSPIFGAGHAVLHNPVREAKLRAEGAATAEGVSPEAIAARKDVAAAQELKDQYDIDNTPFHPEQSTDQLWETLRTQSGRDDVPAYSDLSDKQRKGFNDAVKAKGDATRENKDQPGVYEPKKNTVTAFERIAGKPEKVPVPEAGAELTTPAPETELTTPAPKTELATPASETEPTLRPMTGGEWMTQRDEVAAQRFNDAYPDLNYADLPTNVQNSWKSAATNAAKGGAHPEEIRLTDAVKKYLAKSTPERAYEALQPQFKGKLELPSLEELKSSPLNLADGTKIWDSIAALHEPGQKLNTREVKNKLLGYEVAKQKAASPIMEEPEQVDVGQIAAPDIKPDTNVYYPTDVYTKGLTPVPPTRKPAAPIIEERPVPVKSEAVAPVEKPVVSETKVEEPAAPVVKEKPVSEPKSKLADLTEDELDALVFDGELSSAARDLELKRRKQGAPKVSEAQAIELGKTDEFVDTEEFGSIAHPDIEASYKNLQGTVDKHEKNPTAETEGNAVDAAINHDNAQEAVVKAQPKAQTKPIKRATVIEAFKAHDNPTYNWLGEKLESLGNKVKFVSDDGAGGRYDRAADTITIGSNTPKDVATRVVGHEVAHAVVSHAIDNPTKEQKPYVENLTNLYEKVKDHKSIKGDYGTQDIHEFVSEGLSNPEFQGKLAKIRYKETSVWGALTHAVAKILGLKSGRALGELLSNTEALAAINTRREAEGRIFELPAHHANDPLIKRAVGSGYTTMKDIEAPKTIPERVKGMNSWMDSFFQKFVNEWHGVETTLAPHLGKMVGEKQRADLVGRFMSTAPNFITNALQMGGIELLKDGTMDITKIPVRLSSGKVVNASIYEMQRQVDMIGKEGRDLFNHVAYVLDAADQLKRDPSKVGKHITGNMTEFRQHEKDVADLRAKYPELNDALEMWREINKSLIKSAFDSGLINKKTRDVFMKNASYSPRYMLREEVLQRLGVQEGKPTEVGNTRTKVFRERTAAEHQVNVWENMARHYAGMTLGIMANETKKAIGEQFVAVGAAREVERAVKKELQGNLAVMVNGERKFYKVDSPELIPSMMQVQQDFGPLMKVARGATQVLRTGVLSNPGYWIRQIARDPIAATLATDLGWITPAHTMKELTSIMQGNNPAYDLLARRGVIGHVDPSLNASDVHHFMDTMSRRAGTKGVVASVADKSGNFLNKMHIAVDGATRVAIYKEALLRAAKEGLHGKDAENYAVMMARENINFSVTGSSQAMKQARLLIPFLSAGINGLELMRKAVTASNIPMKDRAEFRRQFLGKVATIGMLSAAYTMYMSGSEEYESIPDSKRYTNWIFPTGIKDHPMAIALPPEFAFIKWMPEMLVRYGIGTQSAQQIMSAAVDQMQGMVPGGMGYTLLPIPQIAKPVFENWMNKSTYTGEDIETKGEHYQLESDRSTAAANLLSKTGMSAPKWDNLFRGYGGELGMAAVWLADMMLKPDNAPVKPSKDFVELPGLGLKGIFGTKYASQQRTDFYTHKEDLDSFRSRLKTLQDQGRQEEVEKLAADPDAKKKLGMATVYDQIGRQMQQLGKEIKMLEANTGMSEATRNERIDQRKRMINTLAAKAEKIYRDKM
jgi:hypothetical protein